LRDIVTWQLCCTTCERVIIRTDRNWRFNVVAGVRISAEQQYRQTRLWTRVLADARCSIGVTAAPTEFACDVANAIFENAGQLFANRRTVARCVEYWTSILRSTGFGFFGGGSNIDSFRTEQLRRFDSPKVTLKRILWWLKRTENNDW